jgi:AcrR family transcriptional regulator
MSKSGLYAHFSSKEELQLAIIAAAEEVFAAEVVRPALEQPDGLAQLTSLCEHFLSYVDQKVFPGGCLPTRTRRARP